MLELPASASLTMRWAARPIREFIRHAIKPKFIGRNPFETEALYKETFHYMRGVGRKGLAFCAYQCCWILLCGILRARS